ncbi:MAG: hypothetical protein D6780_01390, partial [Candidatus Dadabacteria bacterium]
ALLVWQAAVISRLMFYFELARLEMLYWLFAFLTAAVFVYWVSYLTGISFRITWHLQLRPLLSQRKTR